MAKLAQVGTGSLFPILPPPSNPVPKGMARLAAESTHAADGHLIEFRAMESRSILNRTESKRGLWMAYSINPYRGCEFACRYCYARYTHQFLEPVPNAESARFSEEPQAWATRFEREIYLKENAAWLLEQELRRVPLDEEIAIGTATDPYQPIERNAEITRSLLEVFARGEGRHIGIITKSRLIERDIDLLQQISRRNRLVVHVTITTTDADLARKLEPRAPRPDLRFAAVAKLRRAGLTTGILCSPLLPGITDDEKALSCVASVAKQVDASFFAAMPLFLKSCSRPTYLSFVREHFPHLVELYRERFATMDFADGPYRRSLEAMVARTCRRYHLQPRSTDALLTRDAGERKRLTGVPIPTAPQQRLFA